MVSKPEPAFGRASHFSRRELARRIQRICGDHQYSFAVLNRILRRQQGRLDWDRHLASSMWGHILEMTERQEAHSHGLDAVLAISMGSL